MINNYRLMRIFLPVFLILNGIFSLLEASNQYEVHQNAFTFENAWNDLNAELGETFYEYCNQEDYFPVGWAVRQTYEILSDYKSHYCNWYSPEETLSDIFEDAYSAGINFAYVAHELQCPNPEEADYVQYELVANCTRAAGLNVILGGLHPEKNPDNNRNREAWDYILQYADNHFAGYTGRIIGAGGMDAPDGWEYKTENEGFFRTTNNYA